MIVNKNKEIFKAIHRSQHCQRNWDLSKKIPQADLDLIIEAATQCPSKQNIAYYKAHFITRRDIIENIHRKTQGFYLNNADPQKNNALTNPQVLANLLVVFESYHDDTNAHRNAENFSQAHGTDLAYNANDLVKRDQHMAVGIAAGYVNVVSSMLGYGTGCCACFEPEPIKKLLNIKGDVMLLMGVGFPQKGINRRAHHKNGVMFPTFRKQNIETVIWS